MSTLAEIISSRATAGARYADAVTELRAAMIDLAAIEMALTNKGVQDTPADPFFHGNDARVNVRTFGVWPDPITLRHPIYAPNVGGHWQSEANAAHQTIVANAT